MNESMIDTLREDVRAYMKEKRYAHTLGVEREMRYLASSLAPGLLLSAAAAGLLHDITKRLSFEEQIAYCLENGLAIDEDERLSPALLHAKTGAHMARSRFPDYVSDAVFAAIAHHTAAEASLPILSAMLYVADFTEEGRTYPECRELRAFLHKKSLSGDEGMAHFKETLLRALDLSLGELLAEGRPISPKTVAARNAVLTNAMLF